jgi:hypothetical protein
VSSSRIENLTASAQALAVAEIGAGLPEERPVILATSPALQGVAGRDAQTRVRHRRGEQTLTGHGIDRLPDGAVECRELERRSAARNPIRTS